MDINKVVQAAISIFGGVVIGVIGYFLKRTIALVDGCATKTALYELKNETKEKIDKLSNDIESIKEDYLTKADFYRELGKLDRKLDKVIDILIGSPKGDKNG